MFLFFVLLLWSSSFLVGFQGLLTNQNRRALNKLLFGPQHTSVYMNETFKKIVDPKEHGDITMSTQDLRGCLVNIICAETSDKKIQVVFSHYGTYNNNAHVQGVAKALKEMESESNNWTKVSIIACPPGVLQKDQYGSAQLVDRHASVHTATMQKLIELAANTVSAPIIEAIVIPYGQVNEGLVGKGYYTAEVKLHVEQNNSLRCEIVPAFGDSSLCEL